MAYDKKAQAKYAEKCKRVAIKYTPNDLSEYNILESYLSDNKLSFNAYCKNLIRADLQSKGLLNKPDHTTDS